MTVVTDSDSIMSFGMQFNGDTSDDVLEQRRKIKVVNV